MRGLVINLIGEYYMARTRRQLKLDNVRYKGKPKPQNWDRYEVY